MLKLLEIFLTQDFPALVEQKKSVILFKEKFYKGIFNHGSARVNADEDRCPLCRGFALRTDWPLWSLYLLLYGRPMRSDRT